MSRTNRKQLPGTTLSLYAPDASAVFIAGTFNDWQSDTHPMTRSEDGWWIVTLQLSPGAYEYKFVVDGIWCCMREGESPSESDQDCVPNTFGTLNRTLTIEG